MKLSSIAVLRWLPAWAVSLALIIGMPVYAQEAPAADTPAPVAEAPPPPPPPVTEAPVAPAAPGATRLEAVEVTGSRIRRVDIEGPTPVLSISRDQIAKNGYTTVKDILANLTVNAGGSFDAGQSFSFARGTQSIDLRGFGAGRTLILLDGRRLPVFPQGLGGTDAFVDLATIPASIVERIEVALDGASAIYGSDAISGVVNIITRKHINGGEASFYTSATQGGGGGNKRITFADGVDGGANSMMIFGEYTKQNVLKFTDRPYSASDYIHGGLGSEFGSTFVNDNGTKVADPNCGTPADAIGGLGIPDVTNKGPVCRFDRSKFREWIPDNETGSLNLRVDHKVNDNVDTFVRFGYSRKHQVFHLEPSAYQGNDSGAFATSRIYPDSAFPVDPTFGGNSPSYVVSGSPNDPTPGDGMGGYFERRLVEFGPRSGDMTTEGFTGLFGVSGTFDFAANLFNWDAGIGHNEVRVTTRTPTILSSILDNEVSNNALDMFAPIPASVVAATTHTESEIGISRNSTLDGTIAGPIGLPLPGGMSQFALHGEYTKESYNDEFDAITTIGDVFDGGSGGGGHRNYYGIGLEFNFPILADLPGANSLELGLAGRYDRYLDGSDTGGAFSPGAKIAYRPVQSLLLRASISDSFRAPDLQRLYGANSNGFEDITDTVLCHGTLDASNHPGVNGTPVHGVDANNDPIDPSDPCLPITSVNIRTGSNPKLSEERGRNYNLGFSWQATDTFNLTGDWYRIKVKDIVSNLDGQTILDSCAITGTFCGLIQRAPDGTLGDPASSGSPFALVTANSLNLASQQVEGIDLKLNYALTFAGIGKFSTEVNWSHLLSVLVQAQPTAPVIQELGNNDLVVLPRDRQSVELDWDLAPFGATMRLDRVGHYVGANAAPNQETHDDFVKAFTTVNLQGRVDFKSFGLIRLGVNNVFNCDFSYDPTYPQGSTTVQNQYTGDNSQAYSSALGRQFYAQYEIKF